MLVVAITLNMKVMEIKKKMLLTNDYLHKIEPYLNNLIDDCKSQGEWKIHLTMAINFISSKNSNETCAMYAKSDNIEIMKGNETDKIIEELFHSLIHKKRLEKV